MERMWLRMEAILVAVCFLCACLLSACGVPESGDQRDSGLYGRYVERETALPPLIEVAAFTQVGPDTFYLLGKENSLDAPYQIWKTLDGGYTWTAKAAPALSGKKLSYGVFDAHGGLYYSHRIEKHEEDLTNVYETAYLDLLGNSEIVLAGETKMGLDQVILTDDVLLIGQESSMTAVHVETGQSLPFSLQLEEDSLLQPGSFCTYDRTLAVAGLSQIDLYDIDAGKHADSIPYSVPGGELPVIAVQPDRSGFYYCDNSGLYRVSMDGGITERVIDGNLAYFSQPTVQLEMLYPCTDGSFLLLYLENRALHLERLVYDADVAREPSRQLNLYTLRDDPYMKQVIGLYQQRNPDVAIGYHVGIPEEGAFTSSDAIRTLNTEILAGNGPDLLVLDGLSIESYIDKGVLVDLREALADEWEDLLNNVKEVYALDETVFAIPARFSVPFLVAPDEKSIQNLDELTAYIGEQNLPVRLYASGIIEHLYPVLVANWLPGGNTIDKSAIQHDIYELRKVADLLDMCVSGQNTNTQAMFWMHEKQPVIVSTLVNLEDMAGIYTAIARRGTGSVALFPADCGGVFAPSSILGVCGQGNYTDDALDFIRFSVSETAQAQGGGGLAVNRPALQQRATSKEPGEQSFRMQSRSTASDEVLELISYWPTAEQMQDTIRMIESAQTPAYSSESIRELIIAEGTALLLGDEAEDGAVDSYIHKLELFLKESG